MNEFDILQANEHHLVFIPDILRTIEDSAKIRGTGIARRKPEYLEKKIIEGKAIIALYRNVFAGFCYIESWGHGQFVANSGLIVKPEYREKGLAKEIKKQTFRLSREKFPQAKIFGLTTGLAVMKINSALGYRPVTFSELTSDIAFWEGCQSCVNYDILQRTNRKNCLCTGMLYDPERENKNIQVNRDETKKQHSFQVYGRWFRYKYYVLRRLTGFQTLLSRKKKESELNMV